MVAAIGTTSTFSYTATAKPSAGLEFELAKYQKELSDCVNCDSANTAEGRSNIQELHNKISAIQARIERTAVAEPNHASRLNPTAVTENKSPGDPASVPKLATGSVGSLVDVRA
jgi:hypothetical protein